MNKTHKTLTTKQVIIGMKYIYDEHGLNKFGDLFVRMLKTDPSVNVALHVEFLMDVLYKIDTCTEDCWNDLENKKFFSCECNNEPMLLPFDEDESLADIAEG